MSEITIRPAKIDDIAAVSGFFFELYGILEGMAFPFALNKEVLPEVLTVLIRSKLCLVLVAEKEDVIIGFVSAAISKVDRKFAHGNEWIGKVADIFVAESVRQDGVASRLYNAAEVWFRENGCAAVECHIALDNAASRAFFRKQGFSEPILLCNKKL